MSFQCSLHRTSALVEHFTLSLQVLTLTRASNEWFYLLVLLWVMEINKQNYIFSNISRYIDEPKLHKPENIVVRSNSQFHTVSGFSEDYKPCLKSSSFKVFLSCFIHSWYAFCSKSIVNIIYFLLNDSKSRKGRNTVFSLIV